MRVHPFLLVFSLSTPLLLVACSGGSGTGGTGGYEGKGNTGGSSSASMSTSTSSASGSMASGGNCPVFPADNPWNTDISKAPVDPLSATYIASIGAGTGLHPDFGVAADSGIPFQYVNNAVAKSPVTFSDPAESDKGPYPIPANPLIESGSDAHMLMIQTDECKLYELFAVSGKAGSWHGGSGAIWDLKSNMLRPDGWTSADAAGLPIFPGLARYEEASKGGMNHALRFTVQATQSAYASPARHSAGAGSDKNLPPMGMRVRLKASFDISVLTPQAQWVAQTLKKYGMILADNGGDWYISGAPNMGWSDDDLHNLNKIHGSDLEVIQTGPLTPGP